MSTQPTAIEKAVALSSVAHIASSCQVSVQAVYKWIRKGYPPADRCKNVELAVGGRVTCLELLPPSIADLVAARPARKRQSLQPPKS